MPLTLIGFIRLCERGLFSTSSMYLLRCKRILSGIKIPQPLLFSYKEEEMKLRVVGIYKKTTFFSYKMNKLMVIWDASTTYRNVLCSRFQPAGRMTPNIGGNKVGKYDNVPYLLNGFFFAFTSRHSHCCAKKKATKKLLRLFFVHMNASES